MSQSNPPIPPSSPLQPSASLYHKLAPSHSRLHSNFPDRPLSPSTYPSFHHGKPPNLITANTHQNFSKSPARTPHYHPSLVSPKLHVNSRPGTPTSRPRKRNNSPAAPAPKLQCPSSNSDARSRGSHNGAEDFPPTNGSKTRAGSRCSRAPRNPTWQPQRGTRTVPGSELGGKGRKGKGESGCARGGEGREREGRGSE